MKDAVQQRYARHAVELPETPEPPTLGLGDPVALANLRAGEVVLDLGSGPGRDLLAAARAVGDTGAAIGVDFTPEMIERAKRAAAAEGLTNVSILSGELEHLPVPCGSVDVVISNCVINLVDDKRRALIEAYRALRPGGRLALLDTAFDAEPTNEQRANEDSWCACVAGALTIDTYSQLLTDIGFEDVRVERITSSCGEDCDVSTDALSLAVSVQARKPGDAAVTSRPAVPRDRSVIEGLLTGEGLPLDGLRTEDAIVAVENNQVIGVVAVERFGDSSMLRSLTVSAEHRDRGIGRQLTGAALDVARWSGSLEVFALTENAQRFFSSFRFEPVSSKLARAAVPDSALVSDTCCTTATAMRLSFEDADLPLLGRPSAKPLPTFANNTCC